MDDLAGLSWKPSPAPPQISQQSAPKADYYATLRPTPPVSGRSTPAVPNSSTAHPPLTSVPSGSKASTPNNDSFANLVSFHAGQPTKNLSLQDQQRLLEQQKQKQEDEKRRQFDSHFTRQTLNAAAWDTLGSGRSTPNTVSTPPIHTAKGQQVPKIGGNSADASLSAASQDGDEDILAAFSASAPVDKSSHMAPASTTGKLKDIGGPEYPSTRFAASALKQQLPEDPDDDPFGLGMGPKSTSVGARREASEMYSGNEDADDVLGLLGRPVSEFPKTEPAKTPEITAQAADDNPQSKALAELVDMGFSSEKAKAALETTESGLDVQAAVGVLLNQAHEESKSSKSKPQQNGTDRRSQDERGSKARTGSGRTSSGSRGPRPAWMREGADQSVLESARDGKSPVNGEKDPAKYASELGNSFFKTANSLWKTGTKKLNQAVADLNSENDPNQPRWMKEPQAEQRVHRPKPQARERRPSEQDRTRQPEKKGSETSSVTDEALLLEGGGPPPRKSASRANKPSPSQASEASSPAPSSTAHRQPHGNEPRPKPMQHAISQDRRSRLTRDAVEEEASQAYISPARRKRPTPNNEAAKSFPKPQEPEPDLLFGDSKPQPQLPSRPTQTVKQPPRPNPTPTASRPPPPKRSIPPVSPSSVQSSVTSRKAGSAAFKRGDYAEATSHYTTALNLLPSSHPLTIPLLTNRALSYLKTGHPKESIADASNTIELIGPSRGAGESIDLSGEEGIKPMEPYWGKAMMRKAEALEQLEKMADAAEVWRLCVEAGVGGATSISGRNRCEKALRPKPPAARASAPKKVPPRPKPSAMNDLNPGPVQSAEAVNRLRAANAAADKIDDEKFALADVVDGRVSQWKGGKEANLRALLASLENVLWQDAGWKKTSMAELIQPNKVKIVYMKGIAKVHPDKIPTNATTEQRMISASVFATLNEAWEKFKTENNL